MIGMVNFIQPYDTRITRSDRSIIKNHDPAILWFTGLSGSGKTTLANNVEYRLNKIHQTHTYILDGDNIRTGLNMDLGFTDTDRYENIRRIGEVARLFVDAGILVLTAFISPFRIDRDRVRALLKSGDFVEIFVQCPLEICEQRDPKGLYKKARQGIIKDFTGIDSPYEPPVSPELILQTDQMSIAECTEKIIQYLQQKNILKNHEPS
jgi:adenylylsulfate kinase